MGCIGETSLKLGDDVDKLVEMDGLAAPAIESPAAVAASVLGPT